MTSTNTPAPGRADSRLRFGKLGRAHGVRGEVRLFTDDPDSETPALIEHLDLEVDEGATRRHKILRARPSQRFWIVSLEGVTSRTAAEALTGAVCWIERDQLPEPDDDDEIYACDLIDLAVLDPDGQPLGRVVDIFDNGAHEVLVYTHRDPDGGRSRRAMVPFVDDFVGDIDLDAGTIVITPMELDDNDDGGARRPPRRRPRRAPKADS